MADDRIEKAKDHIVAEAIAYCAYPAGRDRRLG